VVAGSRNDSDACGRHDDDDDSLDEDDSLDDGSLDDGDLGGSSFTITRRSDWSEADLDLDRPAGTHGTRDGNRASMAASAPALLAGLPPTHRPFRSRLGGSARGLDNDARRSPPADCLDHRAAARRAMPLCALPMDTLHSISTYCRPRDWASVSSASRGLAGVGREIVARVFRHAGRCALEVGSAWVSLSEAWTVPRPRGIRVLPWIFP